MVASPLKWHGGKHYLAARIAALMPPHTHYVEPYAGGLSVLLAKNPEGVSEVANDVDSHLMTFWRVMRCPLRFEEFRREAEATPFSEPLFESACEVLANNRPAVVSREVDLAFAFFVVCRQSLAGRMKSFAPLSRSRTRRGMNEQAAAWLTAVEGLPAVHARLKRVVVLSRDALDVVRQQDGPDTLLYLDPPYMRDTRTAPDVYRHEMTADQHAALLDTLAAARGKFLLSGYRSGMYDAAAARHGWRRVDFDVPNHAAGGAAKRRMVESVWMNYGEPPC